MRENQNGSPPTAAAMHQRSELHEDGCSNPACVLARAKLRELVWRVEEVRTAILSGDLARLDDATLAMCLDTTDARALFQPVVANELDQL